MRQIITAIATATLCLVVACGDWVELRPASAQDGPGGAGGADTTAATGGSDPGTCDCPVPKPTHKVEFARVECVGGFAVFGVFAGALEFRDRGFSAWLHPTEDETLGQQQALVQWDPEDGVFVRCPLGDTEMTATLWGLE